MIQHELDRIGSFGGFQVEDSLELTFYAYPIKGPQAIWNFSELQQGLHITSGSKVARSL